MKFTKMHGIGNDYVYVNCLKETVENPPELAKQISDRHFGVGSDGLILIKASEKADFEMDMYNADGSRGSMCGNGIRCVAKFVYDKGLTDQTQIRIDTPSGIKELNLTIEDGKVSLVKVDMGAPQFSAEQIPVRAGVDPVIHETLRAGGADYAVTCVSMGNPHCVVFLDEDVKGLDLERMGPLFERHAWFPDRINTEFVNVLDENTVRMRVWERGSGETLACGTGACAAAVAAVRNGHTKDEVTVKLAGGDLSILWDQKKNTVFMTGPAVTVFEGEF